MHVPFINGCTSVKKLTVGSSEETDRTQLKKKKRKEKNNRKAHMTTSRGSAHGCRRFINVKNPEISLAPMGKSTSH